MPESDYYSSQKPLHPTVSLSHVHLHLIHIDLNEHHYLNHDLHSMGCLAFVLGCTCYGL